MQQESAAMAPAAVPEGVMRGDDKKCIWRRAYNRLKPHGEERKPFDDDIVIINAKLLNTSGWQNYYLKRDHAGKL